MPRIISSVILLNAFGDLYISKQNKKETNNLVYSDSFLNCCKHYIFMDDSDEK